MSLSRTLTTSEGGRERREGGREGGRGEGEEGGKKERGGKRIRGVQWERFRESINISVLWVGISTKICFLFRKGPSIRWLLYCKECRNLHIIRYVRVLGALYLRLVGASMEVYNYLEPLYNDYRKLKIMDRNGQLHLSHVDEFVDELLHNDRCCDIILPRIQVHYIALRYISFD